MPIVFFVIRCHTFNGDGVVDFVILLLSRNNILKWNLHAAMNRPLHSYALWGSSQHTSQSSHSLLRLPDSLLRHFCGLQGECGSRQDLLHFYMHSELCPSSEARHTFQTTERKWHRNEVLISHELLSGQSEIVIIPEFRAGLCYHSNTQCYLHLPYCVWLEFCLDHVLMLIFSLTNTPPHVRTGNVLHK